MKEMKNLNILIIYEEELYADGLVSLIKEMHPCYNIDTCLIYDDFSEYVGKHYDISFIIKNGNIDLKNWYTDIRYGNDACRFVIVSTKFTIDDVKNYYEYSINGMVSKSFSRDKIKNILSLIFMGENYYPSDLYMVGHNKILTKTEFMVLKLVRKGYSNKQIAFDMNIMESTVKAHMTSIKRKLKCYNRVQVVEEAIDKGLIS